MATLQFHMNQRKARGDDSSCFVMGIMSGTSLDGVDLCLCEMKGVCSFAIDGTATNTHHDDAAAGAGDVDEAFQLKRVVAFRTVPFPSPSSSSSSNGTTTDIPFATLRSDLLAIMASGRGHGVDNLNHQNTNNNVAQLICRANFDWSRFVGQEVLRLVKEELIQRGGGDGGSEATCLKPFASLEDAQRRILIGSHGQTIWHENNRHSTLQIGDTEVLAHVTGMVVVGNFRAADVAVGGCGAPLVPYFDRLVASLASNQRSGDGDGGRGGDSIAFQNLGGIGNVTFIQRRDGAEKGGAAATVAEEWFVRAFDTGPANVGLNEFIEKCHTMASKEISKSCANEGQSPLEEERRQRQLSELLAAIEDVLPSSTRSSFYDKDAAFSAAALSSRVTPLSSASPSVPTTITALVKEWREQRGFGDYFAQPPPKTAGREQFGAVFAHYLWDAYMSDNKKLHGKGAEESPQRNALCTHYSLLSTFRIICAALVELTVQSVVEAYRDFLPSIPPRVVVSGGGKHHPIIMKGIQQGLEAIVASRGAEEGKGKHETAVSLLSLNALLQLTPVSDAADGTAFDADDAKEAIAFAVLAHEKLNSYALEGDHSQRRRIYSNIPSATGAAKAVALGQISVAH